VSSRVVKADRVIWVAAVVLTIALALAGCSPAVNLIPETGNNAQIGSTSDINPRDPATLQDGGNLRLALTDFPPPSTTHSVSPLGSDERRRDPARPGS